MTIEEDTPTLFSALADAIMNILRRQRDMSFEEAVQKYREVEKDFVAAAPDDEEFALETRRRIAEKILSAARSHEQPFEACNKAWNNLGRLGFSNTYTESLMTWCYADCCLMNEKPEAGIAVLGPLIADFEGRLKHPNVDGDSFYQEELERLHKLLTKLIAQRDATAEER